MVRQPDLPRTEPLEAISPQAHGGHQLGDVPTEGEMSARSNARRGAHVRAQEDDNPSASVTGRSAIEARLAHRTGLSAESLSGGFRGTLPGWLRIGPRGQASAITAIVDAAPSDLLSEDPVSLRVARSPGGEPRFSLTLVLAGRGSLDDRVYGRHVGMGAIAVELSVHGCPAGASVSAELVDGASVLGRATGTGHHGRLALAGALTREQARDALFALGRWPSRLVVRARVTSPAGPAETRAPAHTLILERRLDQVISGSLEESEWESAITLIALEPGRPGEPAGLVVAPQRLATGGAALTAVAPPERARRVAAAA